MYTLWHASLSLRSKSEAKSLLTYGGHHECVFFAQIQILDSDLGHGRSETCATLWHTFDVLDYTNMLIEEGIIKYP